jgi:two-component system sensor histidine kinase BarA
VLTNLVSNAIKFTPQGEVVIRVMVEDTRASHHLLRVSITDTGIGLSKSAQQDLFKAFQQGNPSVSRQFGGTGLGLVISKNIVKLMEGEISFDTGQSQGTTFWFTFKAWICHDHVEQEISLPQKNILALEPHEKSAQLLKATLFRANSTLHVVNSWQTLLDTIEPQHQILLINSQTLADDTQQKLHLLRQRFDGMIVIFTRISDHHIEQADLENYNIYSLTKPIRPRTLLTLIGQGLSTAKHITSSQTPLAAPIPINLHILAVDDHPLNLKLVCTLLEDLGIQVSTATDGLEAVAQAEKTKFDLIIMDIQMPNMSGLEATQAIRKMEKSGEQTPIIALTAHALADEKEQMLQQGMSDYLTKPLQEGQLIHTIEHWTGVSLTATTTIESVIESNTPLALVDWQECLKLAAGKTDLAQDMLKMLLNGLVLQREKVLNSQRENNFPALLAHTHYLHGGTRYCGVPRLRAACQTLETAIKKALKTNMNADDIRELLTPKIDELVQIMNDLIDWRESSTEAHVID